MLSVPKSTDGRGEHAKRAGLGSSQAHFAKTVVPGGQDVTCNTAFLLGPI